MTCLLTLWAWMQAVSAKKVMKKSVVFMCGGLNSDFLVFANLSFNQRYAFLVSEQLFEQGIPYLRASNMSVKNLELILAAYRQDSRVQRLSNQLQVLAAPRIAVNGLLGSQVSFVTQGIFAAHPVDQVLVAVNKEEAAYWQNDLNNLIGSKALHFFPDSFKQPLNFGALNPTQVLERTEVIDALSRAKKGQIIVTYPEALFEKVVDPRVLSKSRIEFKKSEKFELDFYLNMLNDFGFARVDFVYEPGQYSLRGGIIDIFSYGNDYPYRVELFDDEVESIRTFNPLTQLSVKNIEHVSIVPNINSHYESGEKLGLFEILKEDTCVWFAAWDSMEASFKKCRDKLDEFSTKLSSQDKSPEADILREGAFVDYETTFAQLENKALLLLNPSLRAQKVQDTFQFSAQAQPSFGRDFNRLIENLKFNAEQGFTNYIFTDNPKQVERFYAIFEDLKANVAFYPLVTGLHEGFVDPELKLVCYTDHQIFERYYRYRLRQGYSQEQALSMRMLRDLQTGDYVTHIDYGVGQFSGLQSLNVNGQTQECVRLIYKNKDLLYVGINSLHKIARYVGKDGEVPQLSKLGSDAWKNLKNRTKKRVKDIAAELIKLYAQRKASPGFAFAPDNYMQTELEASFIHIDTPDQAQATIDVKEDMLKPYPMDRLICGDVGFGKTEVAIRAAFKAVLDGKQVAILVPTTLLALQHARTFRERLGEFSVDIDYLNRFKSAAQRKETLKRLAEGKLDIIIGTHALLSAETKFKDLGLLIIDEEQKFGVAAKEKLRSIKVNVDTLTLTATPIPRTLQFSLMAARDLSVIRTPPVDRQPIHTEVRMFNQDLIKEAIYQEVNRGGQVFFVHNRIQDIGANIEVVRKLCPDVEIAIAHGQLEADKLEKTLIDFNDRQFDVLMCTNIVETGLDIPNANTMIINNAHMFGLSDLHQLRGRVGRSNKKAYCYLFAPPLSALTTDARKRLKTIEEFSDLGSGFQIAMRDLDIRGAGNLLGGEQSGFIVDVGYETYQRILEEAIIELKETDFKEVFKEELAKNRDYVRDVNIDTDVEMLIPETYVENISERLNLYTELDRLETEDQINTFNSNLQDRFGKVPKQVKELYEGLRLRWICKRLGFERVILKGEKLRCYFVENPQSPFFESPVFQKLLTFVGTKGKEHGLAFKQTPQHFMLVKDGVPSLKAAKALLGVMMELVD